jgi:hypothetical protein
MNKSRVCAILACVSFLIPISTLAQVDLSRVTLRAGAIRTQSPYEDHLWSFYPEVEVGGHFIAAYLSWGASWGYWSDGIDEPLPFMDMVTYSQKGHILAARLGFWPQLLDNHWPIPITVFVGVARQFTKTTYVGGFGLAGNRGQNSSDQLTMVFVGAGLSVPIVSHLIVEAEALQYVAVGDGPFAYAQKNRRAFKCGVAVDF